MERGEEEEVDRSPAAASPVVAPLACAAGRPGSAAAAALKPDGRRSAASSSVDTASLSELSPIDQHRIASFKHPAKLLRNGELSLSTYLGDSHKGTTNALDLLLIQALHNLSSKLLPQA
jgi:hypothetical protein